MLTILMIAISIVSVGILFWQTSNLISVFFGCPFVKSNLSLVKKLLEESGLKKGDIFYELGCGSGEVLFEVSKLSGVKCIGYEISPFYYLISKLRFIGNRNVSIRFQNIKRIDLSKADIIFVYLLPKLLSDINFGKINKNAKVLSVGFPVGTLKSNKKILIGDRAVYICGS